MQLVYYITAQLLSIDVGSVVMFKKFKNKQTPKLFLVFQIPKFLEIKKTNFF
jgi:hypothetical protein